MLTLSSMGCHPLGVVTAITIQDTAGVEDVMALDAEWVAGQARCVLEDMPVSVFKIGLVISIGGSKLARHALPGLIAIGTGMALGLMLV